MSGGGDRVEVVRNEAGTGWRWQLVTSGGRVIRKGSKVYRTRYGARRAGLKARSARQDLKRATEVEAEVEVEVTDRPTEEGDRGGRH